MKKLYFLAGIHTKTPGVFMTSLQRGYQEWKRQAEKVDTYGQKKFPNQ